MICNDPINSLDNIEMVKESNGQEPVQSESPPPPQKKKKKKKKKKKMNKKKRRHAGFKTYSKGIEFKRIRKMDNFHGHGFSTLESTITMHTKTKTRKHHVQSLHPNAQKIKLEIIKIKKINKNK